MTPDKVTYTGNRDPDTSVATVTKQIDDGKPVALPLRQDLLRKSDGHEWGYFGSGPAQTSVALLADVLDEYEALTLAPRFKREVVAKLPREGFTLTAEQLLAWADQVTG